MSRRCWRHAATVVGIALLLLSAGGGTASAHALLLSTTPAAGYTVALPPTQISLTFSEQINATAAAISVRSAANDVIGLAPILVTSGGRVVAAAPRHPLANGQYVVSWQVLSDDGDPISGEFSFAVGPSTLVGSLQAPIRGAPGTLPISVLRALLFIAMALVVGGVAAREYLARRAPLDQAPKPAIRLGATLGLAAVAGLGVYLLSDGTLLGGLRVNRLHTLATSTPGRVLIVEFAAFALAAVAAVKGSARTASVAMIGVVAAEALRAHPADVAGGWGALSTALHLTAAALWTGGLAYTLAYVAQARRTGQLDMSRVAATAYARAAFALFLVVLATGTVQSLLLVRHPGQLTSTGYGKALLIKLALFGAVTVLAIIGRLRLRGSSGRPGPGVATRVEASVLAVVLAVAGVLVTQAPPRRSEASALPPAPVGPVLWQGALLGQISVGVAASFGQLRLTAETPTLSGVPQAQVVMTARITSPVGASTTLALTRCGPGCWAAPVTWVAGANRLALTARSSAWVGGDIDLRVVWPLRSDPAALVAVRNALIAITHLTIIETVSSGPGSHPFTTTRVVSGGRFLIFDLWGNATVHDVIAVAGPGGTDLYFALPDQGAYFQFSLDNHGVLLAEHLATPDHDIRRSFAYTYRRHTGSH